MVKFGTKNDVGHITIETNKGNIHWKKKGKQRKG